MEHRYRFVEQQFAGIRLRIFSHRISTAKIGLFHHLAETHTAQIALAVHDYFAAVVGQQRLLTNGIAVLQREIFLFIRIIGGHHRRTQTVLAEHPAIRHRHRRCTGRNFHIAFVPQARQQEIGRFVWHPLQHKIHADMKIHLIDGFQRKRIHRPVVARHFTYHFQVDILTFRLRFQFFRHHHRITDGRITRYFGFNLNFGQQLLQGLFRRMNRRSDE